MFARPRLLRNGQEQSPRAGDVLDFDPVAGTLRYSRRRETLQLVLDPATCDGEHTLVGTGFDAAQAEATAHFLARLGHLEGVVLRVQTAGREAICFALLR